MMNPGTLVCGHDVVLQGWTTERNRTTGTAVALNYTPVANNKQRDASGLNDTTT